MAKRAAWLVPVLLASGLALAQDPQKEQLKTRLKDEVAGDWVYDDIALGMAQAKKAGKPMMIVFR